MSQWLIELLASGSLVAFPVSLLAGVLAGLNPCCLPIYPAAAGACGALRQETLAKNLGVTLAFVLGLSTVSTVLGVVAGLAGGVLMGLSSWPAYLVAVMPITFGLHMLGVVHLPMPRPNEGITASGGLLGAATAGIVTGLVLTPCSTPVIGGLLAYVSTTGSPWWGGLLLFTYGVGLGLPILLLGTVAGTFLQRLQSPAARRVV